MKDTQKPSEVVVITGASKGLGQAMAVEFARRGSMVVGLARSEQGLAEAAARIGEGRFVPLVVDVADATAVQRSFQSIEQTVGPVSILINNAAIYDHFDFLDAGPERFRESMRINLGGVVNCCHSALMGMTERGTGRIVNVTTFADLAPLSGSSAYSVSKGAARCGARARRRCRRPFPWHRDFGLDSRCPGNGDGSCRRPRSGDRRASRGGARARTQCFLQWHAVRP